MKTFLILASLLLPFTSGFGGEKKDVDPNPSFQKLIAGATRIVVRDGGDICCATPAETLRQPVYFEIKDPEEIKKVASNIKFENGTHPNECACCGHPGIDWYVGDRRVAITAVKHGMGLMRSSVIASFTPESKAWMKKWLLGQGLAEGQIK
jgi:hypothetical protein